jgi:DNA-binding NarL/FixJ family response regulator
LDVSCATGCAEPRRVPGGDPCRPYTADRPDGPFSPRRTAQPDHHVGGGPAIFAHQPPRKWHDGVIHALVCDEFSLFRRQLIVALESGPDVEIVGEAGDSDSALELARSGAPDVVFLGTQLPSWGGVRTGSAIRELLPLSQLVVIFDPGDHAELLRGVRAGASAFVPRESVTRHAAVVARSVTGNRPILTRAAARTVLYELERLDGGSGSLQGPVGPPPVDPRELAVLARLGEGDTFAEAAGAADMDLGAAATMVRNALLKLERHARTEAAAAALSTRRAASG